MTTVTSEQNVCVFQAFVVNELQCLAVNIHDISIQQDCVTAHVVTLFMNTQCIFPRHPISWYGDITWPPRLLDPSECDFSLWGYLKGKMFGAHPSHIQ